MICVAKLLFFLFSSHKVSFELRVTAFSEGYPSECGGELVPLELAPLDILVTLLFTYLSFACMHAAGNILPVEGSCEHPIYSQNWRWAAFLMQVAEP